MSQRLDGRLRFVVLGLIIALGAAFRFWGIGWGLHDATIERRPHPDEWVVYWLFQWFRDTGTLNPCPRAATRCFFDWGSVYPYTAYATHSVLGPLFSLLPPDFFGPRADGQFVRSVLAGRITSAVLSTATIGVVYALARAFFPVTAALLAALLMSAGALPIELAHFATPDSTVSFLLSLALLAMAAAVRRGTTSPLVTAGILIGLTTGAEYHMILLICPLVAAWLMLPRRRPLALAAALGSIPVVYLLSNPYALVDLQPFLAAMRHTLLIRTVDSSTQYQGRFDAYGPDWLYLVRYPLGYGVGALFTLWLLAGALWAVVRRAQPHVLLLAWLVPYGLVVSLSAAKFMRYSLPLFPALAVLGGGAAYGMLVRTRRLRHGSVVVALVAATLYSCAYDTAYAALFSRPDSRMVATRWVEQNVSRHSLLAFEQLPNGLINLPYFTKGLGYRPCFTEFRTQLAQGPMQYVLTDGYALEEHPRVPEAKVLHFQAVLRDPSLFRVVVRAHPEPTFLGMTFPIDGSPHDWRYPARDITVFERIGRPGPGPALCYRTVEAAVAALYPHSQRG